MTIHQIPASLGPRRPPRLLRRKPCPVIPLQPANAKLAALRFYKQASELDEVFPRAGADLYERALLLDPALAKAKVNLGNCHFRLGNREIAEACWVEACEEGEHCAFFNLGWLRQQDGRLDEAIALFRRTNELDPRFPDAYYHLGLTLERIGKMVPARAALRTYLTLETQGREADVARMKLERLP